ncbi:hypothetical protein CK203_021987 [Vitis vinifera]|uniref:Uncharacterized protein n=1 Tax=Vitis vinifera TaxID=29760 RepID=A0A438JFY0_VITVI|nr:hypothetical protein CK203_021987 [Vitis vinifera]
MVLGSNLITNDTLNVPDASCCGAVNTPRFGSPWRVLKAYPWKVPRNFVPIHPGLEDFLDSDLFSTEDLKLLLTQPKSHRNGENLGKFDSKSNLGDKQIGDLPQESIRDIPKTMDDSMEAPKSIPEKLVSR